MIPTVERFAEIADLRQGDLTEIPFPVLLSALARGRHTAVIRLQRKPVEKQIFLLEGVAIDCRSNLVHETLGRYLVSVGKLDDGQLQELLAESLRREVPLGEILLDRDLLDPMELYRQLRSNLARKLLDPFGWAAGTFEIHPLAGDPDTTLQVRTPQLILTGIRKLTRPDQIMTGIRPLLGEPLASNPSPPFGRDELKLDKVAQTLVESLYRTAQPIDQLALTSGIASESLGRLIYALSILGVIAPEKALESAAASQPRSMVESTEVILHPPSAGPLNQDELEGLERRIMESFLSYKRKDAFDLLELPEEADAEAIVRGYLRFARRFAPWIVEAQLSGGVAEKARNLFLAGAEAYAELANTEQRGILLERRRNLQRDRANRPTQPQIATDLLDSAMQYKKGLEFLQGENFSRALEFLQFAADVDPQNALYRAEAAYCRYRMSPMQYGDAAYDDLREAVRIDPGCGTALYYLGLVESNRLDFDAAEDHLRQAIRLLSPDRRPIEALKELSVRRKRKR